MKNKKRDLKASMTEKFSSEICLSGCNSGLKEWLWSVKKYPNKRIQFEIINPLGIFFFDHEKLKGTLYLYYNHNSAKDSDLSKLSESVCLFLRYIYSPILLRFKGILIHACSVIKNKQAFLFLGPSGSGKTTIASLSKDLLILSDEIVLVRKINNKFFAYSTPWWGREITKAPVWVNKDLKAQIHGIFILKQDKNNFFTTLSSVKERQNALLRLCPVDIPKQTLMRQKNDILFLFNGLIDNSISKIMHFPKNNAFWKGIDRLLEKEGKWQRENRRCHISHPN